MDKILVIVESPTKVKTLKKFLGNKYLVESSVGHIRDLPKKGFGIDIDHDFEPVYENLPNKKEVISKLKKMAKECDSVYLSPDPDREGEAIAWHIAAILPKGPKIKRVTFNAITKDAVIEALKRPRSIDQSLVDAQQARRLLDRIVGYKISPILQRRIKRSNSSGSLSAGRVQSVALKLVVDREKEIEAFTPVEYWNIAARLRTDQKEKTFLATLYSVKGKKVEKEPVKGKELYTISNELEANAIVAILKRSNFTITKVEKKEKKRYPVPPFITSTLQQEASRHYGFSANRTMGIAQSLYEGIDLKAEGTEGLITYMRTDSVRLAPEAIKAARALIERIYGKDYLPSKPTQYSSKKSAQDAHEAIRPTNLDHSPDKIKALLTPDQYKLYLLIWRRHLASQMTPAIYDTVSCQIATNEEMILRAVGSMIKFKGFLAIYEEKEDVTENKKSQEEENLLPDLEEGKSLELIDVNASQAFTKPPPRFTEASLVKELEKSGIGRPSTYASIMNKIHSRAYTTKERLTLKPTELGKIIAQMLETHFTIIMDIKFTAKMEDELDSIAASKQNWKKFVEAFWKRFLPVVEKAEKEAFVPKVTTEINCPKCGHKLQKIWARDKYFYGCSNYPKCKFTVPIEALEFNKDDYAEDFNWDQLCPKCDSTMKIRFSRFGAFLGCTRYPDCNGIVNIPKKGEHIPDDLPPCPAIGCDGKIAARKSRFGKTFFSCSNYPDCDVIVNAIEDLTVKYQDHPKTPYKKKTKKKGKRGGSAQAKTLSKELAALLGAKHLSRGEVTKKIWEYIKANGLQDPNNKRLIVPDQKLEKIFGSSEPLDMFKLPGILSKHLD